MSEIEKNAASAEAEASGSIWNDFQDALTILHELLYNDKV